MLNPCCRTVADEVCNITEAHDIYPKLGLLANVGLVMSGSFIKYVTSVLSGGDMALALRLLVGTMVVVTGIMYACKAYVDHKYISGSQWWQMVATCFKDQGGSSANHT